LVGPARGLLDRSQPDRYRNAMNGKLDRADGVFKGCFGCGPENPVGLKLEFRREQDAVVADVRLGKHYAGYREFTHGGVVAALLDEGMGWALLHLIGRYGVTQSLQVTYRRPIRLEQTLRLTSRVLERDGSKVKVESVIEDSRGRLLARGEGAWVLVRDARAAAPEN